MVKSCGWPHLFIFIFFLISENPSPLDLYILISGHHCGKIIIWFVRPEKSHYKLKYQLKGHTHPVTELLTSPDNELVASGCIHGSQSVVNIWNISEGFLLRTINASGGIFDIAWISNEMITVCFSLSKVTICVQTF